jgi:hypothetical protein
MKNHPVTDDSDNVTENCLRETCGSRVQSRSLAWAITIGETILWGTLAWFFADYWLMLPVRYRFGGILVLAGLAAIGLFRLVRFYRQFPRVNNAGLKTRAHGRRSG